MVLCLHEKISINLLKYFIDDNVYFLQIFNVTIDQFTSIAFVCFLTGRFLQYLQNLVSRLEVRLDD